MDAVLLLSALSEIEHTLVGCFVRDVVAAGPYGLWIELVTARGPESLLLTAESALPWMARGASRPPRLRLVSPLGGAARQKLPGTVLAAVGRRGLDRVVRLSFQPTPVAGAGEASPASGGCLILELFGSQPNLLLTEPEGRILETARHTPSTAARPCAHGALYVAPEPPHRKDPRLLGSTDAIAAALEPLLASGLAPVQALRQGLAGVSDLWAREVVARTAIPSAAALGRTLSTLLDRIVADPPDPQLILDEVGAPVAVVPARLVHLPQTRQQPQSSLSGALERLAGHHRFTASRDAVRRFLHRLEERLQSRRTKLQAEAGEFARAAVYQRMGELLVSNQPVVARGATEITLPDHAGDPGATLTIPLDPTLAPGPNAERLFRRARRGRRGALRVASRLADTEAALNQVGALAGRVAEVSDPAALVTLLGHTETARRYLAPKDQKTLESLLPAASASLPARSPAKPRAAGSVGERRTAGPEPRRFVSSEGLPILVGRDNEGNDYLTLHLARSEDLWLHVEGVSGSHVVVRMQGRTGGIPRQTLVEAAKLAAYYSQARNHGKVPVSYTLKKHVRKPRKAPPGLVSITQEKSIVVSPDKSLVVKLAKGSDD